MWNRKNWWDKENWKNYHREFHERLEQFGRLGRLRIWIIYVLSDDPKNGVEIMDAIEKMHKAFHNMNPQGHKHHAHHEHGKDHSSWRPSPGSIYPMLSKMVEEDLISKMEDGRYELTLKGQTTANKLLMHFPAYGSTDQDKFKLENVLTEITGYVSYLEDIEKEKLVPHQAKIELLSERLKKIGESLKKE